MTDSVTPGDPPPVTSTPVEPVPAHTLPPDPDPEAPPPVVTPPPTDTPPPVAPAPPVATPPPLQTEPPVETIPPVDDVASLEPRSNSTLSDTPLERFLKLAVAQAGDPYDSAHRNVALDAANPDTFDCSELVKWAAAMSGVQMTDGSMYQYFQMHDEGALTSVQEALDTPGALLFYFDPPPERGGDRPAKAHVAISLGDGRTIEAMSATHGIKIGEVNPGREWTAAAIIPEFRDDPVDMDEVLAWVGRDDEVADLLLGIPVAEVDGLPPDPSSDPARPRTPAPTSTERTDRLAEAAANVNAADVDLDMLTDPFELRFGLDPNEADTDGDGITDGYELLTLGTNPSLADSDLDAISDGMELSLGLDPTVPDDPDRDASLMTSADLTNDSDGDGISDWGEIRGGTDRNEADTDADGIPDGDELMMRIDPSST